MTDVYVYHFMRRGLAIENILSKRRATLETIKDKGEAVKESQRILVRSDGPSRPGYRTRKRLHRLLELRPIIESRSAYAPARRWATDGAVHCLLDPRRLRANDALSRSTVNCQSVAQPGLRRSTAGHTPPVADSVLSLICAPYVSCGGGRKILKASSRRHLTDASSDRNI
jgi:hypothetical protein